ncbi:MAG: hypothetical protein M3Q75_13345 [Gemmatimonadota bacterium]|nr:hypothetical protein [Gemmatimonadota bacterium]
MPRPVSASIRNPSGVAREGLRVDFHATPPDVPVNAMTDAGGVFVADLEPGVSYLIPCMNAVTVAGQDFPAGTVFRVVVPEIVGPLTLESILAEVIDWSLPAQLAAFAALEARITALELPTVLP